MSAEKRPASDEPVGSQGQLVVKRQNVGSSNAITRAGASGSSSALVQAVWHNICYIPFAVLRNEVIRGVQVTD